MDKILWEGSNRRPGAPHHWVYQGAQVDFSDDGNCNRCQAPGAVINFSSPGSEYAGVEFCVSCIEIFMNHALALARELSEPPEEGRPA